MNTLALPDSQRSHISRAMRAPPSLTVTLALALALTVLPALAAPRHSAAEHEAATTAAPKQLGQYGDWTAATYQQNGQTVCYAFTRAKATLPAQSGSVAPILTVTDRAGSHDEVAITTDFTYPKNATVTVQVDQTGLDFYTAAKDAFAHDNRAATAALKHGSEAIARGPGPKGAKLTDTYSLKGFSAAYEAIGKACPGR